MDARTKKLLNDFRDPDEMDPQDVFDRLDARDAHPVEFLEAKDRFEAKQRDERERADALAVWLRDGGSEKDFEKEWAEISVAAKKHRMLEEAQQARNSAWQSTWRGF